MRGHRLAVVSLGIVTIIFATTVGFVASHHLGDVTPARRRPVSVTLDCTTGAYHATTSIKIVGVVGTCAGNAIDVDADNVTIDLNHFHITGTALAGTGVDVASHRRVTVKNGSLAAFSTGVSFTGGSRNRVMGIQMLGGFNGVYVTSPGTLVAGNTVAGALHGGIVVQADNVTVARNFVRNSAPGVLIMSGSTSDVVSGNTLVSNSFAGAGDDGTGTTFVGNTARGNGTAQPSDGIVSNDASASFKNNTADFNSKFGIEAYPLATDLGGNSAKGNVGTNGGGVAAQCVVISCA